MADIYANRATIGVQESAANTMTHVKLATGVSIFEKVAFSIQRILYEFSVASINMLLSNGDAIEAALTRDSSLTSLTYNHPGVLDKVTLGATLSGTAGNFVQQNNTVMNDFTSFPSGGLLVPSSPLYGSVIGAALSAALYCRITFFFTVVQLKPDQYWELVESYRIIS